METQTGEKEKSRKAGLRVLLAFVLFFLCVAAVNAAFVYEAVETHTGTIVDQPYERGLDYNRTLAAARAQTGFGWSVDMQMKKVDGLQYDLAFLVDDRKGHPLAADSFNILVLRPINASDDLRPLFKPDGIGRYAGRVDFPKPGRWEIKAKVVRGAETFYLTKSLVVE